MENSEIRTSYAVIPPPLFFKLVLPRPRCTLPFPSHSCRLRVSLPVRIGEPFFRNRQVGLRIAQLGMCGLRRERMCLRGKLIGFSAVSSVSLFRPRGVRLSLHGGSINGARRIFLLSPFPFPSHPPFYVFLFFLTTSHNPNGILSNI